MHCAIEAVFKTLPEISDSELNMTSGIVFCCVIGYYHNSTINVLLG